MEIFNTVLFAVNREDHLVEYDVINRFSPNRMLMTVSYTHLTLPTNREV